MSEEEAIASTTGGAISISVFASFLGLCCIGPWAVVLFGVSGAVTMARWAPVRPYIIGVAALMLAFFADDLQWLIDATPEALRK